MKNSKAVLAIVLAFVFAFAFTACSIELGGETSWEYTADNKEGSVQLFNDFFGETFNNTNQTVTCKNGESEVYTETIDGTSSFASYKTTGANTYSFVKDGVYYYAMQSENGGVYSTGEVGYNYGRYFYKTFVDILGDIPDDVSDDATVTFKCSSKGQGVEKDGKFTGTSNFELEMTSENEGKMVISATAKDGLVEKITMNQIGGESEGEMTFTFEYGNASVTVPDISSWTNMDSNEEEAE